MTPWQHTPASAAEHALSLISLAIHTYQVLLYKLVYWCVHLSIIVVTSLRSTKRYLCQKGGALGQAYNVAVEAVEFARHLGGRKMEDEEMDELERRGWTRDAELGVDVPPLFRHMCRFQSRQLFALASFTLAKLESYREHWHEALKLLQKVFSLSRTILIHTVNNHSYNHFVSIHICM